MSDARLTEIERQAARDPGDYATRSAMWRERVRRGLRAECGHALVHPAIALCWECKPKDRPLLIVGRLGPAYRRTGRQPQDHVVRPGDHRPQRGCRRAPEDGPTCFQWGLPSCGPCVNVVQRATGGSVLTLDDWRRYEDMQRVAFGAPSLADRLDEALAHQRALNAAAGLS